MPKITEGQFALGGLTLFAFWLFVALPLLNHPAPSYGPPTQHNDSESSTAHKPPESNQTGTKQIPFAVKIVPPEQGTPEAEHSEKESREKAANEWSLVFATWILALVTGLLFIAAAVQAALFVWQLLLFRESLTDAKIVAEAARDSAKAARESTDVAKLSMVASDRAYIHYGGFRYISHALEDGNIFWRIRPSLINQGNTPARQLRIYTHYELIDNDLPADYSFSRIDGIAEIQGTLGPKNGWEAGYRDVTGVDLVNIANGTKRLYVWGTAHYRDVFPGTSEHVTKFCSYILNITGDPMNGWHGQHNPVEILFAGYPRHNCTDEDCSD